MKNKERDIVKRMGIIFLITSLVIMIVGHYLVHGSFTFKNILNDFYANLGAELLSIAITIIIVDRIIKANDKNETETELKERLLQELHSPVNSVANAAVHELRAIGKLTGKDAWTIGAKLGGKADLSNARLYDANFQNTRLVGANFNQADLRNVNFTGADLTGVNFENAIIYGSKFDNATVLPNGTSWTPQINMSQFGIQDINTKVSWFEKININEVDFDLSSIMKLPVTAKNLMFYLNTVYKEERIAEDELHFQRHWFALKEYGYMKIEDVDNLLKRTKEIREWIWGGSPPAYKIVHISFAIAIENPKHLNLPHWTEETRNRINEGRNKFSSIN